MFPDKMLRFTCFLFFCLATNPTDMEKRKIKIDFYYSRKTKGKESNTEEGWCNPQIEILKIVRLLRRKYYRNNNEENIEHPKNLMIKVIKF